MRPGNLRGFGGMQPKKRERLPIPRQSKLGYAPFGYVPTKDAKSAFLSMIKQLELDAKNQLDPDGLRVRATKIIQDAEQYEDWAEESWCIDCWPSKTQLIARATAVLNNLPPPKQPEAVAKVIAEPPPPPMADPNTLVPNDQKVKITQVVYGASMILPQDSNGTILSFDPAQLSISISDDKSQSIENAGQPNGPSPQRIYEVEQLLKAVSDRPWTDKNYTFFDSASYCPYQRLVDDVEAAKGKVGLTPDKLRIDVLLNDLDVLSQALQGVEIGGKWSFSDALWASSSERVGALQSVLSNIQGRVNVGLRTGVFTEADVQPVRDKISGAKDAEGRVSGGVLQQTGAAVVQASHAGDSAAALIDTAGSLNAAAHCTGMTGDELVKCCHEYTSGSGLDLANCIGTTGAVDCGLKESPEERKACCESLPLNIKKATKICEEGGLSFCKFLPSGLNFVCRHPRLLMIGGGLVALGVIAIFLRPYIAMFGMMTSRRSQAKRLRRKKR